MVPHALAVEAMELETEFAPHGAALTDAVKCYLRHAGIVGGKTVDQLLPDYHKILAAKGGVAVNPQGRIHRSIRTSPTARAPL
jgi:hypothetical protein